MNVILFYDKDNNEKHKIIKKPYIKPKLSRFKSAIFLNNYMQKKKIIKLKENSSIKNLLLLAPKNKIPIYYTSRNLPKYRIINITKSKSMPLLDKDFKLKMNTHRLNSIQSSENNTNLLSNPINSIKEKPNDLENNRYEKAFSNFKIRKTNNFINNYLNKFTETEKPERNKRQNIPMIDLDKIIIKDRIPIKTLKHFHRYLFHNNNLCDCNEEEKAGINHYNQSLESSSQFNNKICDYEIMEISGKKNYVATKLTKTINENEKHTNRAKSLMNLNLKKKEDFHFIMKHPFSNSYFCSSFINQLTDNNNNSYTNNFSQKFQNLNNPLKDKDLIDKLHHLILNPNTSKIRNGELLLMYKKYPKGTFYNIFKNNNEENDLLYKEELKLLEKTKYRKYIIKLNKTMKRIKLMQKKLDDNTFINKKNYK